MRWVLYHRRVLYLRVVALQMAYCTYLFENSVTKIWKSDFLGPHPINIEVLILVFVNMLETPIKQKINKTKNQSFSTFYSIKFKQMKTYNALSGKWPFVLSCMVF